MRRKRYGAVLLGACFLMSGCATITTGTHQEVSVNSTPQGANVVVNSGHKDVTPCSFKLQRNREHIIKISKDGYRTAQVILRKTFCGSTAGNILVGGIIGMGVDAMSGAMYKLVPKNVEVDLMAGDGDGIVEVTTESSKNEEEAR